MTREARSGAGLASGRGYTPDMAAVRARVCVFAKPPRPGRVKTRLVSALGEEGAAELAGAFLRDTLAQVQALPWADPVVATTGDLGALAPAGVETWLQGEGDLGQRIERVMRRALADREQAVALGADTPGLPVRLLEQGRAALTAGHQIRGRWWRNAAAVR